MERITPQIHGRDAKIAEIDGPRGRFEVAPISIDKEGVRCIFYRDDHAHFYFFAEFITKPTLEWIVSSALRGERSGPFATTAGNDAIFRANIEYFLKTRWDSNPTKYGDDSTALIPVKFTWRIVR